MQVFLFQDLTSAKDFAEDVSETEPYIILKVDLPRNFIRKATIDTTGEDLSRTSLQIYEGRQSAFIIPNSIPPRYLEVITEYKDGSEVV